MIFIEDHLDLEGGLLITTTNPCALVREKENQTPGVILTQIMNTRWIGGGEGDRKKNVVELFLFFKRTATTVVENKEIETKMSTCNPNIGHRFRFRASCPQKTRLLTIF